MKNLPAVRLSGQADEEMLVFRDVHKKFTAGRRVIPALRGVSFAVQGGGVPGLIGPDGAGKTTLMLLAVGLFAPDTGQIIALGLNATSESFAVQSQVGYMPQRFGLYEDLSVQENLDLYADLQGVPYEERSVRYQELMQMMGLAQFTKRLAGQLSGGMKQKLGLACTLIRPPRLLLLDEPTVGVDPVSRRELWQIVYGLVQQKGMTVLLSTAYMDEAERCDKVILLYEGEVLGHSSPQQFRDRLRGRVYLVSAEGVKKRTLQKKLTAGADVADAVIQGERVRLVMETDALPDIGGLLPETAGVIFQSVPPRLEDGFVAMLRKRHKDEIGPRLPPLQQSSPRGHNGTGSVIEANHVKRRFGDFYAVKDVSFHVERGEIFGLLGANGAGKSTMFRMLCGLLPVSEGSVRVAGLDLRHAAAAARRRIGYMSQKFSLYGNLSVAENLRFFSSAYGLSGKHQREQIEWALQEFELAVVVEAASLDLPLGHKQRLAMACALMHEPDILFLDEPTSGVDPMARREFWNRINMLAEQAVTIMVTTHFMEEADYCDRLAIMADGKILALGTPEEIQQQQRSRIQPEPTMEEAFIALIEHSHSSAGATR